VGTDEGAEVEHEPGPDRGSRPPPARPPVMWPAPDSGFEADPFSPAGSAQREGLFFQGMARRRGGRAAAWLMIALVLVLPFAYLISVVARHL
jgi:hypothetical protein